MLALSHFEQAAEADPGNEPLVIELSRQWLLLKQTQKALNLLTKAAKHPNATPEVYGWLAEAYLKSAKTNEAIEAGRHAMLTWSNQLWRSYRSLAATLSCKSGKPEESLKVLNRATKVEKVDAKFLIGLADFYAAWAQGHTKQKGANQTASSCAVGSCSGNDSAFRTDPTPRRYL